MKLYLSFPDINKLLRDTEKEFVEMNHKSLHKLAESGKAEVRAIEQQETLMCETVGVFRKIVTRKLRNLREYREKED